MHKGVELLEAGSVGLDSRLFSPHRLLDEPVPQEHPNSRDPAGCIFGVLVQKKMIIAESKQ